VSTSRLIAVVGPTASGKSAVALAVAEQLGDVELISIDSMQVYRGMDIGTAKASPVERARVPHHMMDLVDASDDFTVAEFQGEYRRVLADITVRGKAAILVGGTGLYHRAVVDDLDLPGEWPAIRSGLLAESDVLGPAALHARLATLDPAAAAKIEPGNTRRIARALEVYEGSGRQFSSFGPGLDVYPPSPITQIGLRWDRDVLVTRIEQRVQAMIEAGLVDEVRTLRDSGMSRTAAQALGYKELLAHLDRGQSLAETVEQIVVRTRQFAVRQLRWFQRDPRVRWVDVVSDPVAESGPIVAAALDA
jgi:tRNA dimethylallyltransferase